MILPDSSRQLTNCRDCPRLADYLDQIRVLKPDYHARPVAAWGSVNSRVLIVGLAPGMHGANRTGRPFTGDASGSFLFSALARHGMVSDPEPEKARLHNVRITNAVKCLPPQNRPVSAEVRGCSHYLQEEIAEMWSPTVRKPRCVLALGRVAHQAVGIAWGKPLPAFRHGQMLALHDNLWLADTYHPSRQNTNTRRLTPEMLDRVLDGVLDVLG